MARALRLAAQGVNTTTPNPRVGCVLVREGTVVGEGWHARAGEAHAEALALRAAGKQAAGATAYVTLEPCCHYGRTPPCTEALIAAGVARVVAAMHDPNPVVAGRGVARLLSAGVLVGTGLMQAAATELNIGFVSRMIRGRPWLRLKLAASLDGQTALANGMSQWITSAEARRDGHRWRARACAVLTGIGTVRADDPQLTVREVACQRQPVRVVIDSRLETPPDARLLSGGAPVLIACASAEAGRRAVLEARGAEIMTVPDGHGEVDLPALLDALGARGFNEVHCEAGMRLNGALLEAGCVDELLLYLAPVLLGADGRGMFGIGELVSLDAARRFELRDLRQIGSDLRVLARTLVR